MTSQRLAVWTLAVAVLLAVLLPPLLAGSNVRGWTLSATFASALGTTAVATATALSLRRSRRQLDRLENDRLTEDVRRLALLERDQVLEAARAWEVILAMRGHLARHPLEASLGAAALTAESLDISSTQLAVELARAYRELFTSLYALPEDRLPRLRATHHRRPSTISPEAIAAVRAELGVELVRLTRLAATGRPATTVSTG